MECNDCGKQDCGDKRVSEFPFTTPTQVNDPRNIEYVQEQLGEDITLGSIQALLGVALQENDVEKYWRTYAIFSKMLLTVIDETGKEGMAKFHPNETKFLSIR